jgi:hypothetical protein
LQSKSSPISETLSSSVIISSKSIFTTTINFFGYIFIYYKNEIALYI